MKGPKQTSDNNEHEGRAEQPRLPLVVGIGASAGGLEAFKSFFSNMPSDSGMTFVVVQHLAPEHKSALAEILSRETAMKVIEVRESTPVAADRVFIIPPDATLTIESGVLQLSRPAPPREHRRPIDTFFLSLAHDQGENAVSIVLSGTGSDGTLGLSAIKENGGFTLAQADFDHLAMSGMPRSAAATGLVDEVLPVEEMPARLISYRDYLGRIAETKEADGTRRDTAEYQATIARLLRTRTGHDFSQYKDKTVGRRIQRRMQVLQIDTVPEYIARLREEPHQLDLLFHELLIGVTQFFRDPQAFDELERTVIPDIVKDKGSGDPLRVWVPGCATGEEVYSIAILIKESLEKTGLSPRVQIFGTDIDEKAVAFARAGRYLKTIGVLPERVERWFADDGDELCPIKEIREMCVFSVQSVVKDAPFSRLDLISCRNLLIYMTGDLQERVLRTFHYALKPGGYLLLGPSEGVTRHSKQFAAVDKKHRIFQRRDGEAELPEVPLVSPPRPNAPRREIVPGARLHDDRLNRKIRAVLDKHSPVYLAIDRNFEILRFSGGEAGRYLEPSSGMASLNLFAILRKSLRPVVREAIRTASATKQPVTREDIAVRIDGASRIVTVIVEPIEDEEIPGLCVLAFQDVRPAPTSPAAQSSEESESAAVQALEHELRTVRSQLQSTIDELETANEEMKSATEEYQSVNEELQASNEELETSKEEMQSINEELQTVNSEMSAKNEVLTRVNSDLKNLFDSTDVATLFLDGEMRIRNFTPSMTDLFHLRETDRGRPITDIVTLLDYPDLQREVREVMRRLTATEREVRLADDGMTFIMRIRPYRGVDNVIDGVVMTFIDITQRKRAEDQAVLLLGELDHRVKNILAIVSSVITQTLRTSETPAAFAASMEGRIAAIARAHSLLNREGHGAALLRHLIERELAPYNRGGRNVQIGGPEVSLTPSAGLTLAMAIHELASNASKYGSLSSDAGRLSVTWNISERGGERHLIIVWLENDGPATSPPAKAGFGTILIERTLSHDLDGKVNRQFLPSGLNCTIDIPLTSAVGHVVRAGRAMET